MYAVEENIIAMSQLPDVQPPPPVSVEILKEKSARHATDFKNLQLDLEESDSDRDFSGGRN